MFANYFMQNFWVILCLVRCKSVFFIPLFSVVYLLVYIFIFHFRFRFFSPKRRISVYLVDLVKTFQRVCTCRSWRRYSRERALKIFKFHSHPGNSISYPYHTGPRQRSDSFIPPPSVCYFTPERIDRTSRA